MSAIVLRQFGLGLVYYRRRAVELGAAAGLAAAFNAPLSGVVFSFELLKQPFHAHNCFETILACAIADWVCRLFHGPVFELPISLSGFREWQELPTFALVGLCTGVVCLVFQNFLLFVAKRFHKFHNFSNKMILIAGIWGCLLGVILLIKPEVLGIGHQIFDDAIHNSLPLIAAILIAGVSSIYNGNSDIFKDNKNVFTFSMHSKSNYPAKKSISDLDVELDDNMEDKQYIKILEFYLNQLNTESFDYVFYIAGVDIHFNDRLGKLKITDEGVKKRDELVTENFFSKGVPLCGVLGGGYNKDFNKLVELHSFLHQSCAKLL